MRKPWALTSVRRAWERSSIVRLITFGLGWRVFTAVSAFLANIIFPAATAHFTTGMPMRIFWDPFARYDAGWYFGIARYGYEFVEGGRNNLAFMPVYPLLMRYVGLGLGGGRDNIYLAGIIISWAAYFGAMVVLYHLARLHLTRSSAERALVLLTVFPFGFFFGVVYSEAVFLLFSVTAFYGFATKRWWLGAAAGAFVTATRVNGILILPALAILAWQQAGRRRPDLWRAGLALAVVPLGLACYSLFSYSLTGSFFEWANSITRWNYVPGGPPWSSLVRVFGGILRSPYGFLTTESMGPYDLLNGSAALLAVAAIPFTWRKFGAAYAVLMMAWLWLPLSSGSLEGLGRYCAVLFPQFLLLGSIRSSAIYTLTVAAFAAIYMLCLTLFTNVYPIL
jgi:hypothetical protein